MRLEKKIRDMKNIKRFISIFAILVLFSMLLCVPVYASEYGNEWVYDEPQVVSDVTEDYIKDLNENVFANYANKPQLAIVVINDLPYSITKYKLDLFNEYGVGTAEENCGMLFIFAINDREYALEIGDGFQRGSLLREDLETDFITEDMKSSLRAGDYDSVVLQVAQHLATLMEREEKGIYAQKEADKLAAQKRAAEKAEAERQAKEERNAAIIAVLKKVGIAICIICPLIGVTALAVKLIKAHRLKKRIRAWIEVNHKYISMMPVVPSYGRVSEKEVKKILYEECKGTPNVLLEKQLMNALHTFYLNEQIQCIEELSAEKPSYVQSEYISMLKQVNDLTAFENCHLTSVQDIIYMVDEAKRKKAEMQAKNVELCRAFVQKNAHRIVHQETQKKMESALILRYKAWAHYDRLVSEKELEKTFSETLKELNFQWEVDRFIAENPQVAWGEYFDRNLFYQELYHTENYAEYQYRRNYDRTWMYPLLIAHAENRKKAHQAELRRQEEERRRQEEERRAREERRRREEAEAFQRAQQQFYYNNSSFGSGFGGGHSSGGGFKGGW